MAYAFNNDKSKNTLATVATSGSYDDLNNKPDLATVATSGSYDDLSNKPGQIITSLEAGIVLHPSQTEWTSQTYEIPNRPGYIPICAHFVTRDESFRSYLKSIFIEQNINSSGNTTYVVHIIAAPAPSGSSSSVTVTVSIEMLKYII